MRESFQHWETLDVRWGDQDALGHVNNTKFFVFLESARLRFFEQLQIWGAEGNSRQGPILASVTCNFRHQLRFPARIAVGTKVTRLGNKSFTLEQAIFLENKEWPVADASSVIVWFDYGDGRSLPLPSRLRESLERGRADAV